MCAFFNRVREILTVLSFCYRQIYLYLEIPLIGLPLEAGERYQWCVAHVIIKIKIHSNKPTLVFIGGGWDTHTTLCID